MAFVRQIKVNDLTYRQFAESLLKYIVKCAGTATRIDVVFDVYIENSIKDVERARRSSGELLVKQIVPTSPIKQWSQLLSSGDLKNKLNKFLGEEWQRPERGIGDKTLFVTVDHQAIKINAYSHHIVPELESDHEEGDTRMLLHANHASSTYRNIVISTPDTDVFMIALANLNEINSNVYFLTGTKEKRRMLDLNAVHQDANERFNKTGHTCEIFMKALLGFHGFTGCDSVSAFGGRGKVKPLQLLGACDEYVEAFSSLGTSLTVSGETQSTLDSFVCHMYGKRDAAMQDISSNDVRYAMYCQSAGKISCNTLPPCWNSLKQHIKRSNYQVYVWRSCLQELTNIAEPIGNGWVMTDNKIDIEWMTCSPAPDEVTKFHSSVFVNSFSSMSFPCSRSSVLRLLGELNH